MIELTKGQKAVLWSVSIPMAAIGIAGGLASYANFVDIIGTESMAASVVLAGEGGVLVVALVYLLLTLLGQHTPMPVRFGLWALPVVGSVSGVMLAETDSERVVMAVAPLAMTVAAEGVALVARRVVAFQTGVDLEASRRNGLMIWHANRAVNGKGGARKRSEKAVWRLAKGFAATDTQVAVQLGDVQRIRVTEGADVNLARVLGGAGTETPELPAAPEKPAEKPATAPVPMLAPLIQPVPPQAVTRPAVAPVEPVVVVEPEAFASGGREDDGYDFIRGVMDEAAASVGADLVSNLMTAHDAAKVLGVKPGAIRTYVYRNQLPVADSDTAGRNLFHPDDVAKLKAKKARNA